MAESNIHYEITPPKKLFDINFRELWRFRDLLYIFVWRDIKVRYKQTILGLGWVIFQPFFTMLIFTVFFSKLAQIPSDNVPYPVFVYAGLLYWNYFSYALTGASNCLIENENMIKKIYFPKIILPLSTSAVPMIDFLFSLVVLFGLMVYFHYVPSFIGIILIPVLILCSMLAASGLGLILAANNIKYRDTRYLLPFLLQILLFVTPIIYPVSLVPEHYQWIVFLNPLAGVITLARSTLFSIPVADTSLVALSLSMSVLLFLLGIISFKRAERYLADIL